MYNQKNGIDLIEDVAKNKTPSYEGAIDQCFLLTATADPNVTMAENTASDIESDV